jgi:membrane-associated protein
MTDAANWRDVKAKARAIDPTWDSPERVARRREIRRSLLAAL